MKKIILGLSLFALVATSVALAEYNTGTTANTREGAAVKTVNVSCVSAAVGVREDALLSAWSKFDDAVTAVLTARKSALMSAWSLTDATARKRAVREAWATAKKSRKEATRTYKAERKAAWSTFKTSAKACGGTTATEASGESDTKENVQI